MVGVGVGAGGVAGTATPTIVGAGTVRVSAFGSASKAHMPAPVEPPALTGNELAKWRAEFESIGREAVRLAIARGQGFRTSAEA